MLESQNSFIIILLAGVALILYGMTLSSHSLEKLLAKRITGLMNKLSQSNFLAIVVGISVTTILQSSGAVTSMLVGLGSARVINLQQVMGVIIGTAIGSTLTVQLISFNLSQYAFPIFILSFTVYFMAKKPSIRHLASVFMGFGFLFLGMGLISTAAHHFAGNEHLQEFFTTMRANPFISVLVATLFCGFIHSSAVTIGIAMSLAAANAITLADAAYWVYGANIGTTSTALIAAAGSNYIGKQVAWAHFFYKTISVLIFYPLTQQLLQFVQLFETTQTRYIANIHLYFNLASAALFFPFIKSGARVIEKLFPKESSDEFGAEFLKLNNYQSSALAVSYANREIMRTADIVLSMIRDSLELFEDHDISKFESIKDRDNKVDFLYRETKMFLLDHANKSSTAVNQNIMNMIMFLSDLERAADAIDINMVGLAIKKSALKLEFSEEGRADIKSLHAEVMKVASMAITAFSDRELCDEVINMKRGLAKLEIHLREAHIYRLNKGMRDSINTSSIHLDLLSEYKRITGLLVNHCYNKS